MPNKLKPGLNRAV